MNRFSALVFIAILAVVGNVNAQSNPVSADVRQDYESIKRVILGSADKMLDMDYSFRTTPQVRTFGQMLAHIADTQTALCALVKGEKKRGNAEEKTSKADLSAALKASFDYCDPVYDSMTDSEGAQKVKMFGMDRTKLGVLIFNTAHDNEMYGQLVADMRIKGIVPPSSEGRR
jgi:DinB superfamily